MRRILAGMFVILCCSCVAGADIVVYGIDDLSVADSQLFKLNITTGLLNKIGSVHYGADIEGITWMSGSIVGHTGDNGDPHDFVDLDKATGAISSRGSANLGSGSTECTGLATDGNRTTWGFVENAGFGTVNGSGDFTLEIASTLKIGGVAITSDGQTIYAITKWGRLYEVTIATGSISRVAVLNGYGSTENLEMLSDTEVAFITCDSGVKFHIYDTGSGEVSTTTLVEVDLVDIESFVFTTEQSTATRNTSWGDVKSMFR